LLTEIENATVGNLEKMAVTLPPREFIITMNTIVGALRVAAAVCADLIGLQVTEATQH